MAPLLFLIALAAPVPDGNPENICRSVRANALPDEKANAYQNCVKEEQEARRKVRKDWMTVSPAARAECAPIAGIPISFVAVMTCLEMQPGGDFDPAKIK